MTNFSFRLKISLFIFAVLAVTASLTMFFTYRDVGNTMVKVMESSTQNILKLVELNIKGDYKTLQYDKINKIKQRKKHLDFLSDTIVSVFQENLNLARAGGMSNSDAIEKSLEWLKQFHGIGKEAVCFVFNKEGIIVSHPDPELTGWTIAHIEDIKSRQLINIASGSNTSQRKTFAVFHWKNFKTHKGHWCSPYGF